MGFDLPCPNEWQAWTDWHTSTGFVCSDGEFEIAATGVSLFAGRITRDPVRFVAINREAAPPGTTIEVVDAPPGAPQGYVFYEAVADDAHVLGAILQNERFLLSVSAPKHHETRLLEMLRGTSRTPMPRESPFVVAVLAALRGLWILVLVRFGLMLLGTRFPLSPSAGTWALGVIAAAITPMFLVHDPRWFEWFIALFAAGLTAVPVEWLARQLKPA